MKNNIEKSKGQVALVVLVISAVVLSLGLSMSHKSVTETRISTDEENLKQAFNTAESGIDYYLSVGATKYSDVGTTAQAVVSVKDLTSDGSNIMDYGEPTFPNKNIVFWMVPHTSSGNVDYNGSYKGDVDICVPNAYVGAIKVDYYYTSDTTGAGNFYVRRSGFNVGGSAVTGYSAPGGVSTCGSGRRLVTTINTAVNPVPLMISVTPLVNSARIVARTASALPVQATEISSAAVVGDQTTGVRRTVKVVKKFDVPQFLFDGLVSEGIIDAN